jgi:hypothetical protein
MVKISYIESFTTNQVLCFHGLSFQYGVDSCGWIWYWTLPPSMSFTCGQECPFSHLSTLNTFVLTREEHSSTHPRQVDRWLQLTTYIRLNSPTQRFHSPVPRMLKKCRPVVGQRITSCQTDHNGDVNKSSRCQNQCLSFRGYWDYEKVLEGDGFS